MEWLTDDLLWSSRIDFVQHDDSDVLVPDVPVFLCLYCLKEQWRALMRTLSKLISVTHKIKFLVSSLTCGAHININLLKFGSRIPSVPIWNLQPINILWIISSEHNNICMDRDSLSIVQFKKERLKNERKTFPHSYSVLWFNYCCAVV